MFASALKEHASWPQPDYYFYARYKYLIPNNILTYAQATHTRLFQGIMTRFPLIPSADLHLHVRMCSELAAYLTALVSCCCCTVASVQYNLSLVPGLCGWGLLGALVQIKFVPVSSPLICELQQKKKDKN